MTKAPAKRKLRHSDRFCLSILTSMVICLGVFGDRSLVEAQGTPPSANALKRLSVEELMDIEVTSVSRRPEKLSETASAIQVITQEDIRRSGATSLPEALRLASNLEVAQVDSRQWAISARGFNNTTANKMLVLIDGRTVYTPLYAGVFWDVQDPFLEDIDRIEVISGPGATLWGANAVNGVINVTSKSARDTRGLLFTGGGGTELRGFSSVRYGGQLNSQAHYRVYGKFFERDRAVLRNGQDAADDWHMGQGGFRLDWDTSRSDLVTVQGDYYSGRMGQRFANDTVVDGGNVIGRWSHRFSETSDLKLQLYYDRTHRNVPNTFAEVLDTYDIDFQHRFQLGVRQNIVWGFGYRLNKDNVTNSPGLAFLPPRVSRRAFSGFVQDEIALVKDRLQLTIGTKIEHNPFTGFEYQPSGRLSWKLSRRQTMWGAISRAVRTPSRIDRELFAPGSAPFLLAGGPGFVSEELSAYELGYRTQPSDRFSVSLATFYNGYDHLRSIERQNPPASFPLVIANGLKGESYGAELTGDYRITDRLRFKAGYTEMRIHIRPGPGSTDTSRGSGESHDPNRQIFLRSSVDFPRHVEFDAAFRFVGSIANQTVPAYSELDMRWGWRPNPRLEFSIVGQNLLHGQHAEFSTPNARREIERSVYGKVIWRLSQK
ncbi:MAG TPA: TonB-dependent receptor [Pyrinomonadaceae bacterium]|nr:TonB-dependent receptor [Pyrinomonadaceae bacterium]